MSFYLVDKQKGVTSNKTLSKLKNQFNFSKAGFSGVLDPFATGLLIIATNGDTKFLELMLNSRKTYTGTILFGRSTDTYDTEGEIVEEKTNFELTIEELREKIQDKFIGIIKQTPPKYSNIKVNGKRAHELSRKDIEFELEPVEREVYSFKIEKSKEVNTYDFEVEVSSGTYIRSLAFDLGKEFNIPSMLTELRRTKLGKIEVPNEMTMIGREEIVDMEFESIDSKKIKELLDGKKVQLNFVIDELIVKDNSAVLWIKKIENNIYKIKKRIE